MQGLSGFLGQVLYRFVWAPIGLSLVAYLEDSLPFGGRRRPP